MSYTERYRLERTVKEQSGHVPVPISLVEKPGRSRRKSLMAPLSGSSRAPNHRRRTTPTSTAAWPSVRRAGIDGAFPGRGPSRYTALASCRAPRPRPVRFPTARGG